MSASIHSGGILDINLLPRSQRPAEVSPLAAGIAIAMTIAVIGLVPLSARAARTEDRAASMERQADDAEAHVRALQVDLSRVRALRIEIAETLAQQEAALAELAALRGGTRPLGDDLALLWDPAVLPPTIHLTSVAGPPSGLIVSGVAPGPLEAIAYAQALMAQDFFLEARMVSFAPAASGAGQFTVEVTR